MSSRRASGASSTARWWPRSSRSSRAVSSGPPVPRPSARHDRRPDSPGAPSRSRGDVAGWPAMRLVTFRDPAGEVHVGSVEADGVARLRAPSMLDWLAGEGREPEGTKHDLADVEPLAPVPEPPSVRDFFAFEGH